MNGNGSGTGMTIKEMVTELYGDVKIIKPQVQKLIDADIIARIASIEKADLVVETAAAERRRIGNLTISAGTKIVLLGQFLLALWVAYATHLIGAAR